MQTTLLQNLNQNAGISLMNKFILDTNKSVSLKCNLSRSEMAGLKSLNSRTDLQIFKSDKYEYFVVSQRDSYREVTLHHINSNPDVYKLKYLPPKRKEHGFVGWRETTTDIYFRNQINNAISKHVVEHHANYVPVISFTILDKQSSGARHKISDMISKHEPSINVKEELLETMHFILHW